MKRLLYVFVAALALTGALSSCVKDKGHYDYVDLNGPAWIRVDGGIVYSGPILPGVAHDISLSYALPTGSTDTWEYAWYEVTNNNQKDLVSTDRVFKSVGSTSTRKYMFRLKNNRTGVWYTHPDRYHLQSAGNVMGGGFLFLTKEGANMGVELLARPVSQFQPEWTIYKTAELVHSEDIPADKQLQTEGRTPVRLLTTNMVADGNMGYYPLYADKPIWILTDKEAVMMNGDYSRGVPLSAAFASTSLYSPNEGMVPTAAVFANMRLQTKMAALAIYWNNNWFWSGVVGGAQGMNIVPFENAVNVPYADLIAGQNVVGKEIPITKHAAVARQVGMMMMWDEANKQFLVKRGMPQGNQKDSRSFKSSQWLVDENPSSDNEVAVKEDPSNSWKVKVAGREMIHMDAITANNRVFAVVNDPGVGYRLLQFECAQPNSVSRLESPIFKTDTKVGSAKFFAFGHLATAATSWPYFYYATDKEIYACRMTDGMVEDNLTEAMVPEGHEIVAFKTFSAEFDWSGANKPANPAQNNRTGSEINSENIYLVTKDPTLPEDSCCTLTVWYRAGDSSALTMGEYAPLLWDANANRDQPVGAQDTWKKMQFSGLGNVVDFGYKD